MKFEFNLSISEIVVTYVVMMVVIFIAGFSGHWRLAIVGLPLFLRGLMGWCPIKTLLNSRKEASNVQSMEQTSHRAAA